MVLFYAVGQWNSWFSAMIYLRKPELYPLQLVLREILISQNLEQMMEDTTFFEFKPLEETLKYATIMVATIPILCVYPFLQRFFVKGVMIGAIKG
jgi:putative aldouronate transport system permease protein